MKSDEEKLKENSSGGSEDKDKKEMELDGDIKKVDNSSDDATAADSTKEEEDREDGSDGKQQKEKEAGDDKIKQDKEGEKKVESSEEEKINGKENADAKDDKEDDGTEGKDDKEGVSGEKEETETQEVAKKEQDEEQGEESKSQQVMDTSSDKDRQQANEKEKDKPEKAEEKQDKSPSSQENNSNEEKKSETEEKAMDIEESTKTVSNTEDSESANGKPTITGTIDSTSKESNGTDNTKELPTTTTTSTNNNTTTTTTTNNDNSNSNGNSNNSNSNSNSNDSDNQQVDRPAETEPYEEMDKKKIEEELKEKREHMAENIVISTNGTNGISSSNGSGEEKDDEDMEEEYESAFAKNQEPAISKSSYSANKEADLETKKRLECLGNMERIEKEFTDLKEKFFNDKLTQIKKEIEEIKLGEHISFQERIRELELKKERKIAIAENWKKYQIQSILNMYDAECKQYEDEHNEEATHLRERMVSTLSERQKRISEEKESMRMNDGESRITTRTRRRTQQPSQPQNVALKKKQNPPTIIYSLKENEIMDDYNIIFKSRR